jgi:Leucine-rich repeat (LRR) protein
VFGRLSRLEHLDLSHNRLTRVPAELGKLPRLQEVYLYSNPDLRDPPPEIVAAWSDAILAYLRTQHDET